MFESLFLILSTMLQKGQLIFSQPHYKELLINNKKEIDIVDTMVVESFGAPRELTVKACDTVSLDAYKELKSL